ncbi:hypothetical protein [Alicyclobacillus sp. ALC3]|uniref:hypothetical protein n=1 Tax=Alicyclobacillus sp. ALC3 TaxID=2796143 RepID=UPI0023798FCD|nr:hypothetical protein [Alicyclobacillus sp. ALC3]WDL95271.1 hypothetical protein JC200_12675 [Alicyclobacillus sp. ALC3]
MDRDLHQDMQTIKATEQARRQQKADEQAHAKETSKELTEQVQDAFNLWALEYISGDPDRLAVNSEQPPVGFSIQCDSLHETLNPSWSLHSFDVAATIEHDHVTVTVKDGHWQDIEGYLGNWANWIDEVPVYSDLFDQVKLRKALDQAFLSWYKRMTNPQ